MDNMEDLGDAAGNILDELNPAPKAETDATLVEALRRIEEANLFYTLIKTEIFKDGSARPDILKAVNSKIQKFAKKELNSLLNITQPEVPAENAIYGIPKDELLALRVLAAKVLKKDPNAILKESRPALNSVEATPIAALNTPKVNDVPTPPAVIQDTAPTTNLGNLTSPPSVEQKAAARRAILEKARAAQAAKREAAKQPKVATLPPGGHQGYAVPPNYAPPPQNQAIVHAAPTMTSNGLNVGKLVSELTGNQPGIVALSDTAVGGDPNARL